MHGVVLIVRILIILRRYINASTQLGTVATKRVRMCRARRAWLRKREEIRRDLPKLIIPDNWHISPSAAVPRQEGFPRLDE